MVAETFTFGDRAAWQFDDLSQKHMALVAPGHLATPSFALIGPEADTARVWSSYQMSVAMKSTNDTAAGALGVVFHARDEKNYEAVYFDIREWASGSCAYYRYMANGIVAHETQLNLNTAGCTPPKLGLIVAYTPPAYIQQVAPLPMHF